MRDLSNIALTIISSPGSSNPAHAVGAPAKLRYVKTVPVVQPTTAPKELKATMLANTYETEYFKKPPESTLDEPCP